MKSIHYIAMLLTLASYSCQEHSNFKMQNKITRLSFATGGCYGECPFLAIEIDSSLDYNFFGGKYSKIRGYYKGKISKDLWDSINIKFESLQNRDLDTNIGSVDDLSFQTIIHFGQFLKNIQKQRTELPKDVSDNFFWLMDTYKRVHLTKSTDSIDFETTIQKGPPNMIQ